MKRLSPWILAFTTLFVLSSVGCSQNQEHSPTTVKNDAPSDLKAAITFAAGSVELQRSGKSQVVSVGDLVNGSDVLITGSNSSADLAIKGFGVIKVGADTKIRIASLVKNETHSEARIQLEKGNLISVINREDRNADYSVVTPTAIAGVRGTIFLTSVQEPTSAKRAASVKVAVLSGAVSVQIPGKGEVVLPRQTQLEIEGSRRLTKEMIRPLSAESLAFIKKMSVLHKSTVLEYNTLVSELHDAITRVEDGDSHSAASSALERRTSQEAKMDDDTVGAAARSDVSGHIRRDIEGDPVKLEARSGYKQ